jgi:hypothetical protein
VCGSFFCFFKIGSHKLFAWAGFKMILLISASWVVGLYAWATGAQLIFYFLFLVVLVLARQVLYHLSLLLSHLSINLRNRFKIYMKKLKSSEQKLNKWRESQCSWIGSLDVVKVSVLLNFWVQHKWNQNLSKLFCAIDKLILKFIWKGKRQNSQRYAEGYEQTRGQRLPNFKTYCKVTVTKIMALIKE